MYRASTLGAMAALVARRKGEEWAPEAVDWEAETALPGSVDLGVRGPPVKESGLQVLMTGATGFPGRAILASVLVDARVAKVHCVAVDDDTALEEPHLQHDWVVVHAGSLPEPLLGLRQEAHERLRSTVDAVVLAGAQGHCLNNHQTLRAPNVGSTRQMGLLTLGRRVPMHFFSSNRVTLLDPDAGAALPPVSVQAHAPRTDGGEGFTAAKWAGEAFPERLSEASSAAGGRRAALPVTIHRPCAVVGDEAPVEDGLNALPRYSRLMRAVPRIAGLSVKGYFDFRRVEEVADEIAAAVVAGPGRGGVSFRHYSSGVRVPPAGFRGYMEETYGDAFAEVELAEWVEGARREGIEGLIVSYLLAVTERGDKMVFPFMGNKER